MLPGPSNSEVTTLWCYTNLFIILLLQGRDIVHVTITSVLALRKDQNVHISSRLNHAWMDRQSDRLDVLPDAQPTSSVKALKFTSTSEVTTLWRYTNLFIIIINIIRCADVPTSDCLQCFDAVGWAAGRAAGL